MAATSGETRTVVEPFDGLYVAEAFDEIRILVEAFDDPHSYGSV